MIAGPPRLLVRGSVVACVSALALVLIAPSAAHAQHDHGSHHHGGGDPADPGGAPAPHAWGQLDARLGVIAASYRTPLFEGSYQGLAAAVGWSYRRVHLSAGAPIYRIERNGKPSSGLGDAMLHARVTLLTRETGAAGAMAMVMLPTGPAATGLGMGHTMLMSAAWASWAPQPLTLTAAVGYGHGLGGESAHAQHAPGQPWPLVEPMSFAEVTFEGSAMLALARGLGVGLGASGGIPAGDGGHGRTRVIGGVRASWREGRVETTAELQHGLAGDPFRLRGLVAVAMRL